MQIKGFIIGECADINRNGVTLGILPLADACLFLKRSGTVIERIDNSLITFRVKGRNDLYIFGEGIHTGMLIVPVVVGKVNGVCADIGVFIDLAGRFADDFDMAGIMLLIIAETGLYHILTAYHQSAVGRIGNTAVIVTVTEVLYHAVSDKLAGIRIDKTALVYRLTIAWRHTETDGCIVPESGMYLYGQDILIGAFLPAADIGIDITQILAAFGIGRRTFRQSVALGYGDIDVDIIVHGHSDLIDAGLRVKRTGTVFYTAQCQIISWCGGNAHYRIVGADNEGIFFIAFYGQFKVFSVGMDFEGIIIFVDLRIGLNNDFLPFVDGHDTACQFLAVFVKQMDVVAANQIIPFYSAQCHIHMNGNMIGRQCQPEDIVGHGFNRHGLTAGRDRRQRMLTREGAAQIHGYAFRLGQGEQFVFLTGRIHESFAGGINKVKSQIIGGLINRNRIAIIFHADSDILIRHGHAVDTVGFLFDWHGNALGCQSAPGAVYIRLQAHGITRCGLTAADVERYAAVVYKLYPFQTVGVNGNHPLGEITLFAVRLHLYHTGRHHKTDDIAVDGTVNRLISGEIRHSHFGQDTSVGNGCFYPDDLTLFKGADCFITVRRTKGIDKFQLCISGSDIGYQLDRIRFAIVGLNGHIRIRHGKAITLLTVDNTVIVLGG